MSFDCSVKENNKDIYAMNILKSYAEDWKIFIDTCSLLEPSVVSFIKYIVPFLIENQNKLIIPFRNIEELYKIASDSTDINLQERARSSIRLLEKLHNAKCIEIRGEENDNFADNVFQVVFTKFRMTHKLLLITQDNALAKDILRLNDNQSVRGNNVNVKRLNRYGFLSDFRWTYEKKDSENIKNELNENIQKDAFKLSSHVTEIEDIELPVSYIPSENDEIYTEKGAIRLLSKISSGGEGVIYNTNTPFVAKIYKKESNTTRKYEKIKKMISREIKNCYICYPISMIYNQNKEFVGYLMPTAKGKELQKSLFIKPLFLKNFPDWKKRDTVELCITILKQIKYLHDRNIIIGDINPANILVVSPREVYFVDTDSYQIEDLPCPVGTVNFTAPEIQGKHFAEFLRTKGNENFAIATLLFMIMLPGKPPYSQQGGENPIDNIVKMDFSYPFEDSSNKKTPDGPWRYIWSHLTYDLKKAFYNTFKKDGEYSDEKTRLGVDDWLSIFTYYLELLDSGKYGEQDKMSEELFPTRHKKNPNVEYVICRLCGEEAPEHQCQNGICRSCLNKGTFYRCERCGKELFFSNYEKYVKNREPFSVCQDCYNYLNQVKYRIKCISCGRFFEITNREYEFYRNKGFNIPKRCKNCRKLNKNSRLQSKVNCNNSHKKFKFF